MLGGRFPGCMKVEGWLRVGKFSAPSPREGTRPTGIGSARGFTRIDAIAVGCMLAVTSAVGILPSLGSNVGRSDQVGCLNNLRQIGMAFQSWGSDHGDRRPWFVPMTEGGAREHPLKNNAFIHFTFLSNHLSSPAILVDPAENARSKRVATNWSASPQGGFLHPSFANNALSYMLGVHTTIAEADRILVADRHVQSSGVTGCSYGFGPLMLLSFRPF